jgi:two-component system, response regulator YesN
MIKVLIVEDDKLARKGLIHAMPWADYGMTVVGEAGSGPEALGFLGSHEVDLMMTDYAMPGMSGWDFMRAARERFPALRFVVLTFHQELEFAQEAFRLGALDYIAKVQLDKEGFDATLARIRDRFIAEGARSRPEGSAAAASRLPFDRAWVLIPLEDTPRAEALEELAASLGAELFGLYDGACLLVPRGGALGGGVGEPAREPARAAGDGWAAPQGWAIFELSGLAGEQTSRGSSLIRKYARNSLFYERERGRLLPPKSLAELEEEVPAIDDERMTAIEAEWLALDWIYDRGVFDRLLGELRSSRPAAAKLSRLLVEVEGEWNRIFCPIASLRVKVPERVLGWGEAEAWLSSLRESASTGNKRLSYAGVVVASVMRAARIVDAELGTQLLATDVARRINMSRGYFCRCFKDITGKPFNEYLQCARVEKAKLLLLHTDAQLSQVAEQVGYTDEKYFAKVFRELAGSTPSGYRQTAREGRRLSSPR